MPQELIQRATQGFNNLGSKVQGALVKANPGKNVITPPMPLGEVLTMAASGAAGSTLAEMLPLLGLTESDLPKVATTYKNLQATLANADPQVAVKLATAAFHRSDIVLLPGFAELMKTYGAKVAPLKTVDPANEWASEATNGKIPIVLTEMPAQFALLLMVAEYLKGDWQFVFDKRLTEKAAFSLLSGERDSVDMMSQANTFQYSEDGDLQLIRLPLGSTASENQEHGGVGEFCMYLLSTRSHNSKQLWVNTAHELFTTDTFAGLTGKMTFLHGFLQMPRFEARFEASLNKILMSLGMTSAFDDRRADFSRLYAQAVQEGFHISDTFIKSYVKADEFGFEGAAVAGVIGTTRSLPPRNEFEMILNKPFAFTVCHEQPLAVVDDGSKRHPTDVIRTTLFNGTIANPNNS